MSSPTSRWSSSRSWPAAATSRSPTRVDTPALAHLGYDADQSKDILDYILGTISLDGAPHINRESLTAKGFTDEDLDKVESALASVFELGFAFNVWTRRGDPAASGLRGRCSTPGGTSTCCGRSASPSRDRRGQRPHLRPMTVEGAPHLEDEHLPVFDTANKCGKNGTRFIHHMGHIKMMTAAQSFLSGAISKTINMPNEATVEDIVDAYRESWELGLKAMALYRDGSKAAQPLNSTSDEGEDNEDEAPALTAAVEAEKAIHWGNLPPGIAPPRPTARG